VNHLEISNEFARQVSDRTHRHFQAMVMGELGADFLILTTLQKPRQTNPGQNVGLLGPRGDNAGQLRGACRRKLGVRGAVALPFHGDERTIGDREDMASMGAS